jgi:phenylacetate-CoA ligase
MEAFIRADGRVISPLAFVRTVRVLAEPTLIDRLQFVQETHTHVLVRVVPAQGASSEALQDRYELIRERTKELMGQDCEVTFESVPAIPTTASGKYLYTVSKVRPTAAGLEGFRN